MASRRTPRPDAAPTRLITSATHRYQGGFFFLFFFACGLGGEQKQDYRHDKACYCYLTGRQIRLARPTEMELIVLLLVRHREITTQFFLGFFVSLLDSSVMFKRRPLVKSVGGFFVFFAVLKNGCGGGGFLRLRCHFLSVPLVAGCRL